MNNGGTEALLAAPFAFPAKLVVFLPATLIKKERPFSLEVFRHTGHSGHLLFAAELPICSRNAETPKTVSRCIVSGRFWAFSFDMSGFVLTAVSFYRQPFKSRCLSLPGNKKAPYCYDAFVLLGRWSKGTLFHYLLCFFFLLTTVVPMAAPPLMNNRAIHSARLLESPVWGDLESSFSFAVTVSAFLISFVPSLSL